MTRRHDEDGQPYISYFTREPSMTHFIWNGVLADPVQVTHAEAGEPIDDTFHLTGGGGPVSLAEFKRQCDAYLARGQDDLLLTVTVPEGEEGSAYRLTLGRTGKSVVIREAQDIYWGVARIIDDLFPITSSHRSR